MSKLENSFKQIFKRKVNFTTSVLISFLISGSISFGVTSNTIEIKNSDAGNYNKVNYPFIANQNFTNVDEQYIKGDSLANIQRPSNSNRDLKGIVTTDGNNIELKFNKLQFDITEPGDRNSYSNQIIRAERNGETITMTGDKLILNVIQQNYNGTNSATEKSFSTSIYSKSSSGVILNVEKTTINVASNIKENLDSSGMTADNGGNIEVNGDLNITVDTGKQGYGILTNRSGKVILNGDNNIKVTGGAETSYMAGIRSDDMDDTKGTSFIFNGNSTEINTILNDAKDHSFVNGILSEKDIQFNNHDVLTINTNLNTSNYSKNIGIEMIKEGILNIDSNQTIITVNTTGNTSRYGTSSYGIRIAPPSISNDGKGAGSVHIKKGDTNISVSSTNGSTYGIQATGYRNDQGGGIVEILGNNLVVSSFSANKNAYGVCSDSTNNVNDSGKISIESLNNKITAETKESSGKSYAVSNQD